MRSFLHVLSRRRILSSNPKHITHKRKVIPGSCVPGAEALEPRQLLSVSASTLVGSAYSIGSMESLELLENGTTVLETNTQTVIGRTTFNGLSALETDEMGMQGGGQITTTSKNYGDLTSAGLLGYGSSAIVTMQGTTPSDVETTYSPVEVILPATMVVGTPYTNNTTSTAITTGASSSTKVTQLTTILTLEAGTQPVMVPAGNFPAAYVIDETITTTSTTTISGLSPITTGPITNMGKEYYVPDVGLVELAIGMGATELTSYTKGPPGGGGGGSGISPMIKTLTVPPAVVGGAKLHGALKLDLTNSESSAEKGFTVNVYASADQTLDTSVDTLVSSTHKPSTLSAGKSAALSIPVTGLPASLPDGTYYLIVQTVDSADNADTTVSGSMVTVAAPFVSLSESLTSKLPAALVSGTKANGTVTLSITNNGNVPSKGLTAIDLTASPVSGTPGTSIISLSKNITIAPGKTAKVMVHIKSIPALADNNYFIVAQVTDPFAAGMSVASSATPIAIAAPFVTLTAALGPVTKVQTGDFLTITNNGNIDDVTAIHATLGFSLDSGGADPIGSTILVTTPTLHIKSGKSVKVHLTGWKSILSGLVASVPYFLTASITDATGNSAAAVSSSSFTL